MGAYLSFRKQVRIIIQGLDAAGKTSLLYRLKLGEVVSTIPTIGFNVETIDWNGIKLCAWDLGGRDKIRPLYRHYYANTHGFIYILDSNDRERLDDALQELVSMILMGEDEVRDTVVMVMANKQDLPNVLSAQEIEDKLRKKCPICSQTVFVKSCSVQTGDGINEAFNDFVQQIKLRQKGVINPGIITIPTPPAAAKEQFPDNFLYSTIKSLIKNPLFCFKYMSIQQNDLKSTLVTLGENNNETVDSAKETSSQIMATT
ncbi:Arf GTPase arf1 [Bulinus truncatus]|nr:Arf GTPase arf1 [Bulinus truncatus]